MSQAARILVVDDKPQIHRFLGPALEAAGYAPLRAETGQEGLALLATRRPDALILDLGLPDLDGKAVLERARGACSPIASSSPPSGGRPMWRTCSNCAS